MALDVESHYLRYGPMVLRRCRTLLRDPAKAEDAMQDVFKAGTVQRDDVFVATKLWNTNHRPDRVKPAFDGVNVFAELLLVNTPTRSVASITMFGSAGLSSTSLTMAFADEMRDHVCPLFSVRHKPSVVPA